MVTWARKYREAYPTDINSDEGLSGVLKTGISSFIPVITEEMVSASIVNSEQLLILQRMNLQSVMIVPIINRTKIKGAITFVSSTKGFQYDEADLQFAKNFATHIALALDNTRLNEEVEGELNHRKEIEIKLRRTEMQLKSALSDTTGLRILL